MSESSHAGSGAHDDEGLGHPVPIRVLAGTWAMLVVLTVVTVAATYVDLGELNIFIALGIAVVKSTFVALFFMHLRWDKPFHSIVFVSAALFVMLFISLALLDTRQYAPDEIPGYAPEIQAAQEAAAAEQAAAESPAGTTPAEAPAAGTETPPAEAPAAGH